MGDGMQSDRDAAGRELANVQADGVLGAARDERHRLFVQTLNEAQVDFLLQRTPKHEIKTRQGRGGLQFSYVEHGYVTERLNLVFGFNWDFEVVDKQILEDEVIVEARLTVRTPGGQTIVKTQFGGAEIKRHASGARSGRPLSIADDYKAAASDALKKCASLLGIGLDLYGRDRPDEPEQEPSPEPSAPYLQKSAPSRPAPQPAEADLAASPVRNPQSAIYNPPTPLSVEPGLATRAQQREIATLVSRIGMDMAELCHSLGVSAPSELNEARAERVIKRLRELALRGGVEEAS